MDYRKQEIECAYLVSSLATILTISSPNWVASWKSELGGEIMAHRIEVFRMWPFGCYYL